MSDLQYGDVLRWQMPTRFDSGERFMYLGDAGDIDPAADDPIWFVVIAVSSALSGWTIGYVSVKNRRLFERIDE